jgi:hypothetical protein
VSDQSQLQATPIERCQICASGPLRSVLFLGYIPPVNTMPEIGSVPIEQPAYPLEMLRCAACGHVQIGLEVPAEILFPYSYPYLSGTTRILRENFADLYGECRAIIASLGPDSLIVDIGSNDGTLLQNFKCEANSCSLTWKGEAHITDRGHPPARPIAGRFVIPLPEPQVV